MVTGPLRGRCLCGDIRFRIDGKTDDPVACHCHQCRQWSGHYWTAFHVRQDELTLEQGEASIAWYPEKVAERGFCVICGSSLFYRRLDPSAAEVSVSAGAIEGPTGLTLKRHIFVSEKGDYYGIATGDETFDGPDE